MSGVEAFKAGDFVTASDKLDRAYQALKAPSLGLWAARSLAKLNRLVEAAERYQEVIRLPISGGDPAIQRQAQADANTELQQLSPQVPNIVVTVEGTVASDLSVRVDGAPMASALIGEKRPINPGKHLIQASSQGRTLEQETVVPIGETKVVVLRFGATAGLAHAGHDGSAPAPADTAAQLPADSGARQPATRTLGFVGLGLGGAGLVLGGIAGGIALSKKNTIDANPNCINNRCLQSERDTVNSYGTWRTVSSIAFIGGAALAVTGAVLVFTTPKQPTQAALRLGPGSLVVDGTF